MAQNIETVIVGGGQGGLATSYTLSRQGHEHIILERAAQAAPAWRDDRWDSFCLVTPNWGFRLPGAEYRGDSPDSYMPKAEVIRHFEQYIEQYALPVQYNTQVASVSRAENGTGYLVRTSNATWKAKNVVIATGLFQNHKVPPSGANLPPSVTQLASGKYRNPQALPAGNVLVVGSAQSGAQIAEELYQSGRKVFLCVGSAARVPRRYRGRDVVEWLDLIGFFRRTEDMLPSPRAKFAGNPHVTGKDGGHTLNLHQFSRDGVTLLGHLRSASADKIWLAPDLHESLARVDEAEANILRQIDGYIAQSGLSAPTEEVLPLRYGFQQEIITELNLAACGITSIIWAIGYRFDYSLVKLPVLDGDGFPLQREGVTDFPGLYFAGLPWMPSMATGLLMGVGDAAAHIAQEILSSAHP
jgi:putative flavoprotein involved in K+ transport